MSDHANSSSGLPGATPGTAACYGLAWVPIPILLLTIVALWVADLRGVYESRALMVLLNVFFTWLASLCICVLAARGFLHNGQPGLLMFGCGSLLWGVTSLSAAVVVDRVNATITVHNAGVLGAAVCHFAGCLWHGRVARPGRWLVVGYAGALLAAAVLFGAALAGLTPVFFVQGQGGTLIRYAVLVSAVVLFAWVAWQMVQRSQQQAGAFYHWYGLGLGLVATGLTGVTLLTVQGGVLGWTNRLTQYLGSAYLFVAALAAARETGAWRISLAAVEEAWRKGEWPVGFEKQSAPGWTLRYGIAVVAVAVAYGWWNSVDAQFGPGLPTFITFFPAVMVVALVAGVGPGLVATVLAAGVVGCWIMPPVGHFSVNTPVDRLALALFAFNGALICAVAELYRRNRAKAAAYERETALRESREALRRQAELIDPVRAELIAQEMHRIVRERGGAVAVAPEPAGDTLRHAPALTGTVVATIGGLVLLGWAFGVDALKSVLPGLASMKANTALCFLLSGVALALRDRRAVRVACAALVCAVAGLTLAEYFGRADFGIDQLLLRDKPDPHTIFPGRMVEATALGFLFSNVSLLLLGARTRGVRRIQQTLAVCAGVVGLIAVLGYAYGQQGLYRFAGYSSMALHTAVSLVLLATGLIFARPDGLACVLTRPGPSAQLARRLLPMALLLPAGLGWVVNWGHAQGYFGEGVDTAVLALAMILSLVALVWWTARALDRADAARRATETQLRSQAEVMNQAGEALIVRELGGVIRSWNRGAEVLYGWSAAEALGRPKQALLRTEGLAVEQLDRQLETTGRWEGELIHTTHDGRRVIVESRQTATRTTEGRMLLLESDRDITARKEAEAALRASERFILSVAQASPHWLYVFDLDSKGLSYQNRSILGDLGYPPEVQRAASALDTFRAFMPPEEMPHLARLMEEWQSLPDGHIRDDEYCLRGVDGELRHFAGREIVFGRRADGTVQQVLGLLLDITERKKTEEVLRQSREDLERAQAVGHVGSWRLDTRRNILTWSDENHRIFGLPKGTSMSYETFLSTIHPDDRQYVDTQWQAGVRGAPYDIEHRIVVADQVKWVREKAYLEFNTAGQLLGGFGITQDISERKQAEAGLRASEERYRTLFESIEEMVTLYSVEWDANGQIVERRLLDANPAFLRAAGVSSVEQLRGKTVSEIFGEAWAKLHLEPLQQALATGQPQVQEVHRPENGCHYITTVVPLTANTYLGTGRDITARKHAEEALRTSEARLRKANADLQRFVAQEQAANAALREARRAAVNLTKDAVASRERAEQAGAALRRKETDLRDAQRMAHVGSWQWDAKTDVTTGSDELLLIFGFDPATQSMPSFKDQRGHCYPVEDWERINAATQRTLETGVGYELDVRAFRNGTAIWFTTRSEVLRDATGQIVGLRGTVQDITTRKEAEAVLARSKAELEQLVAERTAKLQELVGELEHFSYTITHDMRAPLRAMRGFGEFLNDLCEDCEHLERKDFLRRIITSAGRMDRLITDALNYSRSVRQDLPVEQVDTGALLRGMLDSYPEFQPSKAQIRIEGPLPVVLGNEAGLTQCFSNLLGNAVKFVKPGEMPDIRVWSERVKRTETRALGDGDQNVAQTDPETLEHADGERVRIWVEDKGIGISMSMLPRVFDMFSRGSNSHEGTGIGLALVRKVTQRMGGRVGLESEEGKGSRFWVELRPAECRVKTAE